MTPQVRTRVMISIAGAGLALGALAGCRHDRVTPPMGRPDAISDAEYPNVVIERPLQQFTAVSYGDIRQTQPSSTSPMRVTVPVRSTGDRQMSAQYQYSWYNASGMPVGESGWKFIAFEPGVQEQLTANALSSDAVAWRLEVRSAR